MKAMIFAAGIGSRLRPLTDSMPKALVEVAGRPAIARAIDRLREAGVDSFVVNIHHFPEQIRRYLASEYPGLDITFSDESDLLLDTGGALVKARRLLEDEPLFIVHNADIVTDAPIGEMIKRHIATGADVTLLTGERESSRRLMFDADGRLRGWQNVMTGDAIPQQADFSGCRPLSFGGIHVVSGAVLPLLEKYADGEKVFSVIPFYAGESSVLNIRSFTPEKQYYWHDIGTLAKLDAANRSLSQML